jgi:hypothetical protein
MGKDKYIVKDARSGGKIIIDTEKGIKDHVMRGSESKNWETMNPEKENVHVIETTSGERIGAYVVETVEIAEGPVPIFKGSAEKKRNND